MEKVKIDKKRLMDRLIENSIIHEREYNKALADYRKAATIELNNLLAKLENGEKISKYLKTEPPTCHLADYSRARQMLEWSLDNEVELTEKEFECFINDNWDWKEHFRAVNSSYFR